MEKQIKETFNEIHAPKSLIEDTKKKVKEAQSGKPVTQNKTTYHLKAVAGIATLAACAVFMVMGKTFMTTENKKTPETDIANTTDFFDDTTSYNAADDNPIKEFEFTPKKQLSDWHQFLENTGDTFAKQTSLDANYVIYTFDYPSQEETYHIEISVENGELYREENNFILKGSFKGEVFLENIKLKETTLNISSSSQFTTQEVVLDLQDMNNDGFMDFLLETAYNDDDENSTQWYTVDEEFQIIPCTLENTN